MPETYLSVFPHTCSCCGQSYDQSGWEQLEAIGIGYIAADSFGPAESMEYRNCVCGSTMAVAVVTQKVHVRQC